ncbi:MAG: tetratricopeptide repeat protein [Bacteroidota bacterium]
MRIIITIIICFFICLTSFSQNEQKVDSLKNILKNTDEKNQFDILKQLISEYISVFPEKAEEYSNLALSISIKNSDKKQESDALINIGKSQLLSGKYKEAGKNFQKALDIKIPMNDTVSIIEIYNSIGEINRSLGNFSEAITNYLKSIELAEKTNSYYVIAEIYNNIGIVYDNQLNIEKALHYYNKALQINQKIKNKLGLAQNLVNIGIINKKQGEVDSSLSRYISALALLKELDNLHGTAICQINIGNIYYSKGEYYDAIDTYKQALETNQLIGNKNDAALCLDNIGWAFKELKSYNKALEYSFKGLNISKEIGSKVNIRNAYHNIADILSRQNNYQEANKYLRLFIQINDSIFSEEAHRQINEIDTKYQTEKKEKEIVILNKEKEVRSLELKKQQVEIENQKIAIISFIAGLLITIFFSVFLFRFFKQKKKANKLLAIRNEQINQQKEEIQAQRDLAAAQRDLISEQKQDITDSIQYAYKIQSAIFPSPEEIILFLKDYFILYKPRDIVSGDFYWINKVDKKIIIIAADCTGHGVPGAFMSMLGYAFMNEIVNKERITSPARILDRLRENIILALKQHGNLSDQRDGMDVAAIAIDLENQEMEYSGANNPLYMIRNNELIETKADKMPVSVYPRMNPFSNFSTQIHSNDVIYIFSDGFADQFGGKSGKKFKYSKFKELILSIKDKSMKEQEVILDTTFEEWKGSHNQIDDVLVIGIKV